MSYVFVALFRVYFILLACVVLNTTMCVWFAFALIVQGVYCVLQQLPVCLFGFVNKVIILRKKS